MTSKETYGRGVTDVGPLAEPASPTELAALVRSALEQAFPKVRFSVHSSDDAPQPCPPGALAAYWQAGIPAADPRFDARG